MVERQEPVIEKRRFPRVRALHLVSYSAQTGGIQKIPASIGRTLDISSSGTRLEVYESIDPISVLEVEIAVGDLIFSVRGKHIHSSETDKGIYIVGIEFDRLHPEIFALLNEAADGPSHAS